jgi:hypothetical protein
VATLLAFVAVVAVVAEAADPSMLVMPVNARDPVPRFKATDVVPIKTDEFPRTVEGIVPVSWAAFKLPAELKMDVPLYEIRSV